MIVALGVLAVVLLFRVGGRLADPRTLGIDDFAEYWAAGRLNATGGNPYSPGELLTLQRQLGWSDPEPIIMWNPPWTLALAMPFAVFDFPTSRLLWLILQLVVLLGCVYWLWRYHGGLKELSWVALLIGLCFFPTALVLRMGQISVLLLLAVVGFLHFERRRRDWLAGACLALAAVKPQLLYLVAAAVLWWALSRRRWGVLLGGAAALGAASAVALLWNPHVFQQYRDALTQRPPASHLSPTLGTFLRLWLGWDQFWLQLVPSALGFLWLAIYLARHRSDWDWARRMPALLFASVLTTSYGAWHFDLVVLLLPVIEAGVWMARERQRWVIGLAAGGFLFLNGLALLLNVYRLKWDLESIWFAWLAPALMIAYYALRPCPVRGERSPT